MNSTDRNRTRTTEKPTVCLIGQNESSRRIVVDLIDSRNLEIETFEFINVAFVVLDLSLPGMLGRELQLRLCSEDLDIPVIVTCSQASSDVDSVATAFKLGAIGFLETPLLARQMATVIQKAIECRTVQQQRTYFASFLPTS